MSPDSLAFRIYQQSEIEEAFNCNYELNPAFQGAFEGGDLHVPGVGENEEARIIELINHPFFLATAFQPQFKSESGRPHPIITAFLETVSFFTNSK